MPTPRLTSSGVPDPLPPLAASAAGLRDGVRVRVAAGVTETAALTVAEAVRSGDARTDGGTLGVSDALLLPLSGPLALPALLPVAVALPVGLRVARGVLLALVPRLRVAVRL